MTTNTASLNTVIRDLEGGGAPLHHLKGQQLSGLVDVLHGLDLILGELALALLSTLAHLALKERLR